MVTLSVRMKGKKGQSRLWRAQRPSLGKKGVSEGCEQTDRKQRRGSSEALSVLHFSRESLEEKLGDVSLERRCGFFNRKSKGENQHETLD
jgi:hypothetical protein